MTRTIILKLRLFTSLAVISMLMILCSSRCSDDSPAAGTIGLNKYLDTLWVDSLSFAKLDTTKRIVFEFKIGGTGILNLDTLTMDGWTAPNLITDPFNDNPNISLLKGRTDSSVIIGPGTYLGNQSLYKKQLKTIQDMLSSNMAHYVLFAPKIENGHVSYTIFLGFDDPTAKHLIPFTTPPVGTGQSSNPSPPKNYSDQ
jgi:hypothetical protein